MKNIIKYILCIASLAMASIGHAFQWSDLWQTPDQQGAALLQAGDAKAAAQTFKDKAWQAVSWYRAGDYVQAFKQFSGVKTSDDQYNAGNAAAFAGKYPDAIKAYDQAIALNANNADAIANRNIIKKLLDKKNQEQKQQQNNANNKDKDKNKEANNNKDKNNSQSEGDSSQNDSSSGDKDKQDKQKSQQNDQQSQNDKNQQQPQAGDNQTQGGPKKDDQKQDAQAAAESHSTPQDESKKQLLRRLADDPGGLMRQKFLRDYMRRHAGEASSQGDNDGYQ
jgi:Ca-activated chloride channel homolog